MDCSTMAISAPLAVAIGYTVGKMLCWKTWTGYVGLVIVAPLAIGLGVDAMEALFDCVMLGVGLSLARPK